MKNHTQYVVFGLYCTVVCLLVWIVSLFAFMWATRHDATRHQWRIVRRTLSPLRSHNSTIIKKVGRPTEWFCIESYVRCNGERRRFNEYHRCKMKDLPRCVSPDNDDLEHAAVPFETSCRQSDVVCSMETLSCVGRARDWQVSVCNGTRYTFTETLEIILGNDYILKEKHHETFNNTHAHNHYESLSSQKEFVRFVHRHKHISIITIQIFRCNIIKTLFKHHLKHLLIVQNVCSHAYLCQILESVRCHSSQCSLIKREQPSGDFSERCGHVCVRAKSCLIITLVLET
jgi:hypothetical protein